MQTSQQGFTLIELMVVLVIITIFAVIAIPSYQVYSRRAVASTAQQEIQRLADQLERHKGKNFSYLGFDASYMYKNTTGNLVGYDPVTSQLVLPVGATGSDTRYKLFIRDGTDTGKLLTDVTALGQRWAIRAESTDPQNFSYLMTSTGLQCRNKTAANVTFTDCGTGGENKW
ncbi:prepilin-type N-terminal cleavage/methylation domain-containing protein [Acinetobacter modestus]|uniref:type IV pilin protein n=1 Tax=Acinetobacter modestus TaxID=1776740 RepID=UPI001F4A4122|nr:prepilin-type N-terminal cleavage/methylation domain-containing protein [Acinetobacter modestus]MCH7332385.1 prepilin-type N-terminal cleavage/methylation domain-containing protein [Acinetobacter modestus]MCH7386243.1 prepilin-type N-terminal cleavage/methylation domain-containing protein [Acinetobacter modestus]